MNSNGPIGADFHGTFDKFSYIRDRADFISTGKGYDQFEDVYGEGLSINVPVFFNPMKSEDIKKGYPLTVVNHKANIINKTGASEFYEDEPKEVAMLKLMCPKCKIRLVPDDL